MSALLGIRKLGTAELPQLMDAHWTAGVTRMSNTLTSESRVYAKKAEELSRQVRRHTLYWR
jgi:hypothetical protein